MIELAASQAQQASHRNDLFDALFPMGCGFIELRLTDPPQSEFVKPGDHKALDDFLGRHKGKDIYFGVSPRLNSNNGGGRDNCGELWAIFADLDLKETPDAQRRIEAFALAPSAVIASGGGYHLYWILNEPVDVQREGARVKSVLRRLALTIGADIASAEPARILRVPGTFNHKPEYGKPRLVTIERLNGVRYDISDLDDFLPLEPEPPERPRGQSDGGRPGDDFAARATWKEILEPHGWRLSGTNDVESFWTRPGKTGGTSATSNYRNADCFYVFSDKAAPFAPNTGYSKFAVYALLNHAGDFKAAAAELRRQGYGQDTPPPPTDEPRQPGPDTAPGLEPAAEAETRPYIEFAPAFLSVEDPPVEYLIAELLPKSALALMHGEPRTRKSWAALEIAIALATGTLAFGMERFAVPGAVPVLYSSQEDAAREVRARAKAMLRGRNIERFPDTLAFSIHRGINLESHEWQEALLRDLAQHKFALAILDPIRRFAMNVDKGPSEVRAVTAFLRRLTVETGAAIMPVHHDVKPGTDGRDDRRRGHRASGGDWFAAAECPISFEQAGDNCSLVVPEDYKFSVDPQAFTFQLETDGPKAPTWARLIGQSASSEDAKRLALQQTITGYLSEHPGGASGTAIGRAVRKRKEDVLAVLDQLLKAGQVDCFGGGGRGKKQTWFLCESRISSGPEPVGP